MTARAQGSVIGPLLVVVGLLCQEVGAALAVVVFPEVGAIGMVALRLVFSGLLLLVISRPRVVAWTGVTWRVVVSFGLVLAAMNVFFYLALERLPLGPAVTIETLGPLVLSVVAGRRWMSVFWAGVAGAGVVMLGAGAASLDPLGVAYALGAAACWAGYIVLAQRTGQDLDGVGGLAVATSIGALATVPLVLAFSPLDRIIDPVILLIGLGVAILSSAIPYAAELSALRRLSAETFSVLLSLAPAIAAFAGFVVLGQALTTWQLIGIACVIAASAGAVRTAARRTSPGDGPDDSALGTGSVLLPLDPPDPPAPR